MKKLLLYINSARDKANVQCVCHCDRIVVVVGGRSAKLSAMPELNASAMELGSYDLP